MKRRPPLATRTEKLLPAPTLFRSAQFGFRISPKLAVAGAINSSIDSSELRTGSILRASGLATFGSSFDIYAEGNRISFGTAKIGDNRFGSSTNRFRLQRSEEHTSELQSLMRSSYAVFCF